MKLHLFYPVKPWHVFQDFGECHPSVCEKYKALGLKKGHKGIDVPADHGEPVRAAHGGTVVWAGIGSSDGVGVILRTHNPYEYKDHQAYYETLYWHLCTPDCHNGKHRVPVTVGDRVKAGEVIGYANNTGFSTGDHLHFEAKPVYKGENKWDWRKAEPDNGFHGAVDPKRFFNGIHAEDIDQTISIMKKLIEAYTSLIANLTKPR